ncbi:MAG: hypothetical protein CfP315_0615 [Candidatus Improbicoccus pseudotrichonymphae]|uniref:Uncharacterized protein n=1 Tax=Candidatus Improbicoccus pseudotrichonymphae TaxID=3033792 RepID=A0AA48I1H5_9FIRM|nr:MAG: hypothetical protein CfP315_0615 [Candidatus Improbicoccus pseudotrichonymphae]
MNKCGNCLERKIRSESIYKYESLGHARPYSTYNQINPNRQVNGFNATESIFTNTALPRFHFSPLFPDNLVYQNNGFIGNFWFNLQGYRLGRNGDLDTCLIAANAINLFPPGTIINRNTYAPANYTWHHVYMGWFNFANQNLVNGMSINAIIQQVNAQQQQILINNVNVAYYDATNWQNNGYIPLGPNQTLSLMQLVDSYVHGRSRPHYGSCQQGGY